MVTPFIAVSIVKIGAVLGLGMGTSALFSFFHEHEFKLKKKGDKNAKATTDEGQSSLRERAKLLG